MKNLLLIMLAFTLGRLAQAQNVNIPDPNMKAALLAHNPVINTNGDEEIQLSEAKAVVGYLNLESKAISNMTGIEAFVNIITLYASNNSIGSIDLSDNTKLVNLFISSNNLSILDLSSNEDIAAVYCYTNNISTFTLPADPSNLHTLNIGNNPITGSFDFTPYTSLTYLGMFTGGLTTLDVSMLSNLTTLSVANNSLTSLDVSMLSDLHTLYVNNNELTSLHANNGMQLQNLSVEDNAGLECISVFDMNHPATNQLKFDDGVSFEEDCNNPTLKFIDPRFEAALLANSPTIDANGNGTIQELEAADYSDALNLSDAGIKNTAGIEFFVSTTSINLDNNEILSLDLNQNAALTALSAINNNMTILQIKNGNNANFTTLNLAGNDELTCINVDDPTFAASNWTGTPAGASYSTDCVVNFPEINLKNKVISLGHDTNADGEIQISEAESVDESMVLYSPYTTVSGLEAFKNFTGFVLSNNSFLYDINLTSNSELTSITLENNRYINELDLSLNPNLKHINVSNNDLLYLDLRNGNNQKITSFNARFNDELTCVYVDDVTFFETNFSNGIDEGVSYDRDCSDPTIDIPDANFMTALLSHSPAIDANADGEIRHSEAIAFDGIMDVSSSGIVDLTGISLFKHITGLIVDDNQLTELDINFNEALTSLSADNNDLTWLNVANRNNEALTVFSITGNSNLSCVRVDDPAYSTTQWTDIDSGVTFGNYCDLDDLVYMPDYYLYFSLKDSDTNADQKISFGEALAYTDAESIRPDVTDLTGLEAFINMEGISYSGTHISHFDVSKNTGLKSFTIGSHAEGMSVDLGDNTSLETLSLSDIDLSTLDLSNFISLESLYLVNCNLSNLTLTQAENLTSLRVRGNNLTSLNLTGNPLLEQLSISNNPLTSLDLTANLALTEVDISLTGITSIDVSHLTELEDFRVESGSLTSLDVSQNTKLNLLYASEYDSEGLEQEPNVHGALTQVLLPSGSMLQDIDLSGNQIQSIDIPALTNASLSIYLDWNGLQTITMADLTSPNLFMSLDNNAIEILDVSGVTGVNASVSAKNNHLSHAVIGAVNYINLTGNVDLECVQTLDVSYAESTYTYDEGLIFGTALCPTGTITAFSLDSQEIPELAGVNAAVGNLQTTGIDLSGSFSYTLVAGTGSDDNALFQLSDNELQAKNTFDFESATNPYSIRVKTDDGAGNIEEKAFEINVTNVNEAPTHLDLNENEHDEDVEAMMPITDFFILDPDTEDTHTVTLVAGAGDADNGKFEIHEGELVSKNGLDFEAQDELYIRARVTDAGGLFFEAELVVFVNNVEEVPVFETQSFSVSELAENSTSLGNLVAEDPEGTTLTFDPLGGENGLVFEISPSGELSLIDNTYLDFEGDGNFFEFTVNVTDEADLSTSATIQVMVLDANEAPTELQLDGTTISESIPTGSIIGTFSTTDVDGSDSHTYTLVSMDGDDLDNAAFDVAGNQLVSNEIFDFETKDEYQIYVRSIDSGGLFTAQGYTITVQDISSQITTVTMSVTSIIENAAAGTTVGELETFGEDLGSEITYSEVSGEGDGDNEAFEIVDHEVRSSIMFDYETKNKYSIRLKANDENGLTLEKVFSITILDELESSDANILTFVLEEQTGEAIIDQENHAVSIEVVPDTDRTVLEPEISISEEATISPSGVQDFTVPVTYTVTAEDGSTQDWVVTVSLELRTGTDLLSFTLTEQLEEATINTEDHTVSLMVVLGSDITALQPSITVSEGATISPLGAQDFTAPVTYTVTAEDGTTQDWIAAIAVEEAPVTSVSMPEVSISLYPNPVTESFTIESEVMDSGFLQMINMKGQVVRSQTIVIGEQVAVSELPNGLYHIRLLVNKKLTTTKILIRR